MAKRRTIGKDPLAEHPDATYSAEIVPISTAPALAARPDHGHAAKAIPPQTARPAPALATPGKARRAIGGRLEILGGDLGSGSRTIWPLEPENRIGFVAPNGRRIDLGRELANVRAWDDHTEHRYLSAIGWAWVLASIGGAVGLVTGGGLRLLEPRRKMVAMQLRDGSRLVVRTDEVTVSGLTGFAGSPEDAKA